MARNHIPSKHYNDLLTWDSCTIPNEKKMTVADPIAYCSWVRAIEITLWIGVFENMHGTGAYFARHVGLHSIPEMRNEKSKQQIVGDQKSGGCYECDDKPDTPFRKLLFLEENSDNEEKRIHSMHNCIHALIEETEGRSCFLPQIDCRRLVGKTVRRRITSCTAAAKMLDASIFKAE